MPGFGANHMAEMFCNSQERIGGIKMLLLRLWNYICGYVIIKVEGHFLEKFINICIRRHFFLWDIKKLGSEEMTLRISIRNFKKLRPIAKKTHCRVSIITKRGLPFVIQKYKSRKAFAAGAAVFVAIIYILTSFVWAVEVSGNEKVDTELILERLAVYGVKPGVLKYRIDTEKVANSMMMDVAELSWIGVELRGTKIKVEVAERSEPPELVPKDMPCDIVAAKDGVIDSIIAKIGDRVVKEGDTVKKGQVLISGTVKLGREGLNSSTRQVHAIGSVMARTWYEANCEVKTTLIEKERTGKKTDNYTLVLFNKEFRLFPRKVTYQNYDREMIKKQLSIGDNFVFPFQITIDRFYENSIIEREISLDEAKRIASYKAYNEAIKNIPEEAKLENTYISFIEKEDGTFVANVIIECIEEIGITQKIGGN